MTILEHTAVTPRHRRGRAERPERLVVNGETLVRNDVKAREIGATERTINRGDARGAPYVFVAGVKYRPETRYNDFLLSHIKASARDRALSSPTHHHLEKRPHTRGLGAAGRSLVG